MPTAAMSEIVVALITTAILFIFGYMRKKAVPVHTAFKRILSVPDRVDAVEKNVEHIKKRQLALIDLDPNPILIMNGEGEVTRVNSAFLEMTEMGSDKEALGFGYLQAIPEKERDNVRERMELFVEHPSQSFSGEMKFWKIKTKTEVLAYFRSESINKDEKLYEIISMADIKK